MTHIRRKLLTIVGIIIVFAVFLFAFLRPDRPQPVALPNPNGYDDFLKAAALVTPAALASDPTTMSDAELQNYIQQNTNAISLIGDGFAKQSRVPVRYTRDFPNRHSRDFASLKNLLSLMIAQGQWHLRQLRTNNAARTYAQIVQFGHHALRGGLLMDKQFMIGIEAKGTTLLRKLVPSLDAPTCRELITTLQVLDANEESFEGVAERERKWSRAILGFRDYWRMRRSIIRDRSLDVLKGPLDAERERCNRIRHQRYELIAQLAARAFELEHGRAPRDWSDLSPANIKNIPPDFWRRTNAIDRF